LKGGLKTSVLKLFLVEKKFEALSEVLQQVLVLLRAEINAIHPHPNPLPLLGEEEKPGTSARLRLISFIISAK
jgi:hypothetical protein